MMMQTLWKIWRQQTSSAQHQRSLVRLPNDVHVLCLELHRLTQHSMCC
jgi:hypothetical protein